ncbi:MAG TPA: aspartate 1-decarboxylase [Candidatus Subteraquimicrobiales bacterium]
MFRTILKGKIHRATVTEANIDYRGSITIDRELLEAVDILPYEKVQVVNVSNGARLETYALAGESGSGTICVNGAAAHLANEGDMVIIISYVMLNEEEARIFSPKVGYVDEKNRLVKVEESIAALEEC